MVVELGSGRSWIRLHLWDRCSGAEFPSVMLPLMPRQVVTVWRCMGLWTDSFRRRMDCQLEVVDVVKRCLLDGRVRREARAILFARMFATDERVMRSASRTLPDTEDVSLPDGGKVRPAIVCLHVRLHVEQYVKEVVC